jgi:hypothetical protein
VSYDESVVNENSLKLLHYEETKWTNVTTANDVTKNVICGTTASLSPVVLSLNSLPVISQVSGPSQPIPLGTAATVIATFSDGDAIDGVHSVAVDWGDGSGGLADIVEASLGDVLTGSVSGTATATHTYSVPGVYEVLLTATDPQMGIGQGEYRYVVVFDPSGGFVTGGGWIPSPAGAYGPDPSLQGSATFGFVSRYARGTATPIGQTQFLFRLAGLEFQSSKYDWLVVAGARAQFKGRGTVNAAGDYGFMLSAVDGDRPEGGGVDKFRIKIWDIVTGQVIYDNQQGASENSEVATALGAGSIVIHK